MRKTKNRRDTFARNFSIEFPSSKIDPKERREKKEIGENFVNNAAKIRARFDESWMATRIVAFGLKGRGEKGREFKRASGSVVYFEKAGYERQLTECSLIRM